ncbi:MAG TPA: WecB/TagA/CpsF family glycosyltransferase [Patescibacteria group bacterium]|nr:WecB/TagA/CpsF family glycosyltransferase [Patescibacteria group bacterium]
MTVKEKLLGVDFTNLTQEEVLEYIVKKVEEKGNKFYVVTPNPEILVIANNDSNYKKVLNQADLALADGVGVMWASKVLKRGIKEKITGVDLMENLCKRIADWPITVSFLGGGSGIAERTAECLQKMHPSLKIRYAGAEMPDFDKFPASDILFVAFGSPKQEFWIEKNLKRLPIQAAIGVGGAFDFVSGNVPRAPKWVRDIGLEWLFRLIIQPWRAKRQLSLIKFVFLVIRDRLGL